MLKNNRGFTLIELSVTVALLFIVLGAASSLLFSGLKSWAHGEEQIDVVQNMRVALDYMVREIREAEKVVVDHTNRDTERYQSYLTAVIPDFNHVTGQFSGSFIHLKYRYDAWDQEIERSVEKKATNVISDPVTTGSFQPLASKIQSLSFSDTGYPPMISIGVTGVRKDGYTISMQSQVTVRSVSR